ncbi:MAG: DUF4142 domain-containing protein [Verrucomicrobia bacterium]|nr:DUF4142 domain-containing protein [Verrucomicrobiota bacterium]
MKIISLIAFGFAFATALPAVNAASSQDQVFVNEAATGGLMEIQLGKLASQKSSTPDVKQFGERMVTDHTRLNTELGTAAKASGLKVPTELTPAQKAEYNRLSKLSGKAFDKSYITLMVKDHTDDLASFQKQEAATRNAKLKKAVSGAIPVIQEHLDMAKSASTKLASS